MSRVSELVGQPYVMGILLFGGICTVTGSSAVHFCDKKTTHQQHKQVTEIATGSDNVWNLEEQITLAEELGINLPFSPSATTTLRFEFEGDRLLWYGTPFRFSVTDYQTSTDYAVDVPRNVVEQYLAKHNSNSGLNIN